MLTQIVLLLLFHTVCLQRLKDKRDRVENEEYATFQDAPWHVILRDGRHSCLGVAISSEVAMTTASCIYDCKNNRKRSAQKILVYGDRVVKEIVIHPDFHCERKQNDNLALLKLKGIGFLYGLPLNIYAKLLGDNTHKPRYEFVKAFGYTNQTYGRRGVHILRKAIQRDLTFPDDTVEIQKILVHDIKSPKCFVDSVLATYKGNQQYVIGIMHVPVSGCLKQYFYTRLGPYIDWIKRHIPEGGHLNFTSS